MSALASTAHALQNPTVAASGERLRVDIQALRGVAILLVVLQHSELFGPLKAGYLGVDVFFVVSGYLITGIVQRGVRAGTFSFSEFYLRRAKRLLPAAYVTFGITILVSPLFLTQPEMSDLAWQVVGAVTFTGNIALWMQTGYFEGAAQLKPLLHVWSLSIEEQYYLLLPAALVFTPRRLWRVGAMVVVLASLGLCLLLMPTKPGATFYLLPTRAWELALGSLGVLALEGSFAGALLARLFWPALAALLLLPFFPTGRSHPGADALIICVATMAIILRRHAGFDHSVPVRGLARLGDISYSLYLVHWPLLAFAANAWVSPIPGVARLAAVILALAMAWALHRWVENPARHAALPTYAAPAAFITAVLLVAAAAGMYRIGDSADQADYSHIRRANLGLHVSCDFSDTFTPKPECQTSAAPRILIWGDSYAMHLLDGLVATTDEGLVQATKSTCGPLLGIAAVSRQGWYNRAWAETCLTFNDSVLAYLAATPSVDTVVMSSVYGQYLAGSNILARGERGELTELAGESTTALRSLRRSITAARQMGKKVVLVAPPPSASGVDFGRCLELRTGGKAVMGADSESCAISEARFRSERVPVQDLLDQVSREENVTVIQPADYLCKAGTCAVELDGLGIYRDAGHLSHDGSRVLGIRMDLGNLLLRSAR